MNDEYSHTHSLLLSPMSAYSPFCPINLFLHWFVTH